MTRHVTRVRWDGTRMITERFRVRTQPFQLVRVKPRSYRLTDVLFLGTALFLWFCACFLITLGLIHHG